MSDDVNNMCKKRTTELWKKHLRDPLSVRMWKEENEDNVFHYHEFRSLDLNEATLPPDEQEASFCLAIQTPWQLEIILRYGHKRQIAINVTFGTNEPKVCYASCHNLKSFHLSHLSACLHCPTTNPHSFMIFTICHFVCLQYPLYIVMVFDEWKNGIPIAFVIVGKSKEKDIMPWLKKLNTRCCIVQPNWQPGSLIVDNAHVELNAIA